MANHLKGCEAALRRWETEYGAIKGPDAKRKAREGLMDAVSRVMPGVYKVPVVDVRPSPVVSQALASLTLSDNAKTVVLEPVSDHAAELPSAPLVFSREEPAIEGDVNGSSGTFYAETVEVAAPVEKVDGWPVSAKLTILGLSPNRRMLRGRLGEKVVSVERKTGVQTGAEVTAKLMMAGQSPLYRVVA